MQAMTHSTFKTPSAASLAITLVSFVIAGGTEGSATAQLLGEFTDVRSLGPHINTPSNELGVDISNDRLSLFVYSNRPGGHGDQDLWVAERNEVTDTFGPLENLGSAVNTEHYEGGPHLSDDGLTLFFNSDRPGGFGDQDIYMATRESVSEPFGNVVNLGKEVNSEARDAGPILSTNELILYFQSERPGGEGGRDIYTAMRESSNAPFLDVLNLGTPINSRYTELRGSVSRDGLTYFFTSTCTLGDYAAS